MAKYLKLQNMLAAVWTITGALLVEAFCFLRWWHPACNLQTDGVGYYAIGIPLPFAEPTVMTSDYVFVPALFVLDIVILIALIFPIFLVLSRRLAHRNRTVNYVVAAFSCVLLMWEAARWILSGGFMFIMAASLTTPHGDSYFSYRPAIIAAHDGNGACDPWWTDHPIFPPMNYW